MSAGAGQLPMVTPMAMGDRLALLSDAQRAWIARRLRAATDIEHGPVTLPRHHGLTAFPLSLAQERLWFLQQVADGTAGLEVTGTLRLSGVLEVDALTWAIDTVSRRHEVLRTVFPTVDGRAAQVVCSPIPLRLHREDLSSLPANDRHRILATQVAAQARRPFALALGPLWRVALFTISRDLHVLAVTLHHLIADAWSVRRLVEEVAVLYRARIDGRPAGLAPLTFQYADYAVWQRERVARGDLHDGLAYWQKRLAGTAPFELATDRRRPARPSFSARVETRGLHGVQTRAVESLCARAKVTPFILLFGAFAVLLARRTGRAEVSVLSPVANREGVGLDACAGCFVNVVALQTAVDLGTSFLDLLPRMRACVLEAQVWQHVPFELVAATLHPERRIDRAPLSTLGFAYEPKRSDRWRVGALAMELQEAPRQTVETDLVLVVSSGADGIVARIEYRADLFEGPTIRGILADYTSLLTWLIANPDTPVAARSEAPIAASRRSQTVAERVIGPTLMEAWAQQVHRTPERTAVVGPDGEGLTYAELGAQARCVAAALARRGATTDTIVGVVGQRTPAFLVGLLGVLEAGSAFLPLDPAVPERRLRHLAVASKVAVLLADVDWLPLARDLAQGIGCGCTVLSVHDARSDGRDAPTLRGPSARDLAYVIFTSGSTGAPKGVMVEHRGLLNHLRAKIALLQMGAADRLAHTAPSSFDVSIWQWFAPLLVGGSVVVVEDGEARDPQRLLDRLEGARVSLVELVPSVLRAVADEIERQAALGPRLGDLRAVVVTGEALSPALARRWLGCRPAIPLVNAYGPTECSDDVTHYEIRTPPPPDQLRVPIGWPIAQVDLYVDDGAVAPVRPGLTGELCVGGVAVARGYIDDPEQTAAVFRPDPFAADPTARLYRTGDFVTVLADGSLDILGRRDRQVKVAGCRIELDEVESALRDHPDVEDVAVVMRRDADATTRLVAYIVPCAERAASPESWRLYLAERVPAPMVPARLISVPALPLTVHGKIDRAALEGVGWVPEAAAGPPLAGAITLRAEDQLRRIWEEVLGVEGIGSDDDFFALGGDSIGCIQVSARAGQVGLRVTIRQLFEHPTLRTLAKVVQRAASDSAEQGLVVGPCGLLPAQAACFAQAPGAPARHVMATRLVTDLAVTAPMLSAALERLLLHHDALRMRFRQAEGNWTQQVVLPEGGIPVHVQVLTRNSGGDRPAELDRVEAALVERLSLTDGPLAAITVVGDEASPESLLVVVVHHLVCDAVSAQLLVTDLATVLGQLSRGEDVILPAKTTSVRAWGRHLESYGASSMCRAQLPYWLRQHADAEAGVPIDYPGGRNCEADAETIVLRLDPDVTSSMVRLDDQDRMNTARERLLGALLHALTGWMGTSALAIAVEGHGRDPLGSALDLSRTVGWFACSYPVRCDLAAARSVGDSLTHAREVLGKVPDQGIGYGVLRYLGEAAGAAALGRIPPPEIKLNYVGAVDAGSGTGGSFRPLWTPPRGSGALRARAYVLELTVFVMDGRMHVAMEYSSALHRRASMEKLMAHLAEAIDRIVKLGDVGGAAEASP